jgi:thiamine-monophosphate kinase
MAGGAEFEIIRSLAERWGDLARGLGSDCAVLDIPAHHRLLASTDTTVEGLHFQTSWLTPREIGYRAGMGAWSDLAAAAAAPIGALVAISAPQHWVAALPDLADGLGEAARGVGAPIVGGDTTGGPALVLTLTVLGSALQPLTRAGARPGDRVYVTGTLGGPRAALLAWERGESPDPLTRARFARPAARLREAQWLAARGTTAAVDISDGLIGDAGHLAAASGVRVAIDLDRVPRWPGVSALDAAASGEEYELVVTASVVIDSVAFAREFALPITQIGEVVAGAPGVDARLEGRRVDPIPGYDHFSR